MTYFAMKLTLTMTYLLCIYKIMKYCEENSNFETKETPNGKLIQVDRDNTSCLN